MQEEAYETAVSMIEEGKYYRCHLIMHIPSYQGIDMGQLSSDEVIEMFEYDGNEIESLNERVIKVMIQGNGYVFVYF